MDLSTYLKVNFSRYKSLAPSAEKIHQLLSNKNVNVINDHIALRTVNLKHISKEVCSDYFLNQGYEINGSYSFEEKKLEAIHLEKVGQPKIFISELKLECFNSSAQEIIKKTLNTIPDHISSIQLLNYGRKWSLSFRDYQLVFDQSPYAAWCLAIGFCPNHFTIDIDSLDGFNSLR